MVLDGRNALSQVIGMMNPTNSVNPKLYEHGNTEPSVRACVETVHGASVMDEDKVRTTWKRVELSRNVITARKGSNKTIISTIVGIIGFALMVSKLPPYRVIGKVQVANSVEAKALSHANTELSSERSDKCVQTIDHLSLWDKDIVGTYRKLYELSRNEIASYFIGSNRIEASLHP